MKQQVVVGGVLAQIQKLAYQSQPLVSGIITDKTHFIFRSRSTRIIWLVQLSYEMYTYDEKGVLYFEKFLKKFVEPVLDLWRALGTAHSLTVVFFARTVVYNEHGNKSKNIHHENIGTTINTSSCRYDGSYTTHHNFNDINSTSNNQQRKPARQQQHHSISHEDYFKVVLENAAELLLDKTAQLKILKKEFWMFLQSVGWDQLFPRSNINDKNEHDNPNASCNDRNNNINCDDNGVYRQPSDAACGNFLEALNTALNLLDKHYMDRDLARTGNSIVVISPGE